MERKEKTLKNKGGYVKEKILSMKPKGNKRKTQREKNIKEKV